VASHAPSFSAAPAFADDNGYEPIKYAAIRRIEREVPMGKDDVFVDIGCGKGRIVCMVARRQLKSCLGIEFMPELAAASRRNAITVRGRRTPIEIREADAATIDYAGGTVFFLYNSFGATMMRRVLEAIQTSIVAQPRAIRIIYANPMEEHVFQQMPWLRCVKTFRVSYQVRWSYRVTVWENVG
jgi:SAM-dependent methyltransferase